MAYVEVRKGGELVMQRLVDDEQANKGCSVRLGSSGKVDLCIGESKQVGKFHVSMHEGYPSEGADKAVGDLKEAVHPIPTISQTETNKEQNSRTGSQEKERYPRIEGFEITGRLGEGGMGTVWRGMQLSTRREVAIKFLGSHRFGSKKSLARFEREVALAAKLNHPNISGVYHSGIHRGVYYYAMELVDGIHLDTFAYKHGLNEDQIILLMNEICDAIKHAHKNGVIHRDLKPSNILVTSQGKPYIVDFGLAKAIQKEDQDITISISGDITGTPAYMAPEQAAGRIRLISPATDVYSLGIIFYQLMTGHFPHNMQGSRYDILKSIIEDEVLPPRFYKPGIDREIERIILKALSKDPGDRYATATELTDEIENYLAGRPLAAKSMSWIYLMRKRLSRIPKPVMIAVACLLVAIFTVLMAFSIGKLNKRSPQIQRLTQETKTQNLSPVDRLEEEEKIHRIVQQYIDAFSLRNDDIRDEFEQICDQDITGFIGVTEITGRNQLIMEYNQKLKELRSDYDDLKKTDNFQTAEIDRVTAYVSGKIHITATLKNNKVKRWDASASLRCKKINDRWLITHSVLTLNIPSTPPATPLPSRPDKTLAPRNKHKDIDTPKNEPAQKPTIWQPRPPKPPKAIEVDGRPFFVMCARSAVPAEFAVYAQAGFNVVSTHKANKPALDLARDHGLFAVAMGPWFELPGTKKASLRRNVFNEEDWNGVENRMRFWSDDPALFGWALPPHPIAHGILIEDVKEIYYLAREHNPQKPAFLAFDVKSLDDRKIRNYLEYSDVLMLSSTGGLEDFSSWINKAIKISKDKPLWIGVKAWQHKNDKSIFYPDKFRAEFYRAINNGASGLFIGGFQKYLWTEWNENDFMGLSDPRLSDLRREVLQTVSETKDLIPSILAGHLKNEVRGLNDDAKAIDFKAYANKGNSIMYIIAVNSTEYHQYPEFKVPTEMKNEFQRLRGNELLTHEEGVFSDEFGPYATHIYILSI